MNRLLVFKMFGLEYFLYVLLAIGITIALVFPFRSASEQKKKILNYVLMGCLSLFVILEFIGRCLTKNFNFFDNLPIEYFHIFTYIIIFSVIKNSLSWQRFAYLIMAPVSLFFTLFPSEHYLASSPFGLQVVSFYLINICILSYSILNMLWMEEGIEYKHILIASMDFVVMLSAVHIINVVMRFTAWGLHSNCFGTMGEEYNLIISVLYKLIPVSLVALLPLVAILIGVEFLLVLPFAKSQDNRDRQSHIEELVALGNMKAQQEYRQKMKSKSQILVRSETKAMPSTPKDVGGKSSSGFVSVIKEVKTNNETKED